MLAYGSLKFKPFWGKLMIKCSHTLLALSSAVNIIIYSYKVTNVSNGTVKCIPQFLLLGFPVPVLLAGCNICHSCTEQSSGISFNRIGKMESMTCLLFSDRNSFPAKVFSGRNSFPAKTLFCPKLISSRN